MTTEEIHAGLAQCEIALGFGDHLSNREQYMSALRELIAERQARERAERERDSLNFMIGAVHSLCDERGVPKPPGGEPGIPWRVLRLLERAELAEQRLAEQAGVMEAIVFEHFAMAFPEIAVNKAWSDRNEAFVKGLATALNSNVPAKGTNR